MPLSVQEQEMNWQNGNATGAAGHVIFELAIKLEREIVTEGIELDE